MAVRDIAPVIVCQMNFIMAEAKDKQVIEFGPDYMFFFL